MVYLTKKKRSRPFNWTVKFQFLPISTDAETVYGNQTDLVHDMMMIQEHPEEKYQTDEEERS